MNEDSRGIFIESIATCLTPKMRPSLDSQDPFIHQFAALLQKDDIDDMIIIEICKAIVYLCEENSPYIKPFIDNGTKNRLLHMLTHKNESVIAAALRALRSLILPKQPHIASNGNDLNSPPRNPSDSPSRVPSVSHDAVENLKSNDCFQGKPSVSRREEPKERKEELKEWLVSPLTGVMHTQHYTNLLELDFITCQNVEMFRATKDDANDREKEAGAAIAGQIGLRCIHCGLSPFARAHFSTVYPGE